MSYCLEMQRYHENRRRYVESIHSLKCSVGLWLKPIYAGNSLLGSGAFWFANGARLFSGKLPSDVRESVLIICLSTLFVWSYPLLDDLYRLKHHHRWISIHTFDVLSWVIFVTQLPRLHRNRRCQDFRMGHHQGLHGHPTMRFGGTSPDEHYITAYTQLLTNGVSLATY